MKRGSFISPGSSPLTRGKRLFEVGGGAHGRLIPAHAGKTIADAGGQSGESAHPRSRGENLSGLISLFFGLGSSPLTRGKRLRRVQRSAVRRLIPAHAGKTVTHGPPPRPPAAHPRSRGENAPSSRRISHSEGSSPLTRGKRPRANQRALRVRLIPAHAGKTPAGSARIRRPRAHPRSRGENLCLPGGRKNRVGSSPLTRGKHFLTCAFTAQIDQILEPLELAASSGSYSIWVACATDAPQDQVRSIGLVLPSSRGAS